MFSSGRRVPGDDIQAAKAGVLETADVIVVNKADLPDALATRAALENAAILPGRRPTAWS